LIKDEPLIGRLESVKSWVYAGNIRA